MTVTTTILWIHGWGTSPRVWGHDGSVVHIEQELPGYQHIYINYSNCETSADFENMVRNQLSLHQHENQLTTNQYVLVGWSLGAMLTLEAVMAANINHDTSHATITNSKAKLPIRIMSTVIVSGTLKFTDSDRSLGWPQKIVARMRSKLVTDRQEVLQQFRSSMITSNEQGTDWTNHIHQLDTDFSSEGLEAGLTYLMETDLRASWDARSASIPNLLWIHGMIDVICPSGAVPLMTPPINMTRIEAAGHLPFLSHSKLFYEQLRGFLQ